MKNILTHRPFLVLAALSFLLIFSWFYDGRMLLTAEEGTTIINVHSTLENYKYLWSEMGTGVSSINNLPRLSLYAFFSMLSLLGFSPNLIQALYFWLIMLIASFSIYLLIDTLLELKKDKKTALYAAIFYLFNPFALSQIWARGLYTLIGLYALMPLTIFLLIKSIKEKKNLYIFLLVLSSLIFSDIFVHPTTLMTYWIVIGMVYAYYFLSTNKKLFIIRSFILLMVLWIGVNSWWFLSFINGLFTSNNVAEGLANSSGNIETLKAVSGSFPLSAVVRLMQYFYFKESWSFFYDNPYVIAVSWLIPIVAYFSLDKIKKYKNIGFFIYIFLISLFVVLGANAPSGNIFLYFFEKIPYLQAYRNPYEKFGVVFLIAYTPFFAIGLVSFTQKIYKQISILFLVCVILILPFWNKTFCGIDTSKNNCWTSVPEYVYQTNDYLKSKKGDFRAMMLPLAPQDGVSYSWPAGNYFGVDPTKMLIEIPSIANNAPGNRDYYNVLLERFGNLTKNAFGVKDPDITNSEFRSDSFFDELQKLNVRYIIVRNDMRTDAMGTISVEEIKNIISKESRITFDRSYGQYDIYEVNISDEISILYSIQAEVEYTKINPTLYKFKITKDTYEDPTELLFLATFNNDWKIKGDNIEVISHDRAYSYANKYLLRHDNYVEGELYYEPQKLADMAMLISFLSTTFLLMLIARYRLIDRNKN